MTTYTHNTVVTPELRAKVAADSATPNGELRPVKRSTVWVVDPRRRTLNNDCPRAKVVTAAIGAAVVVAMGALTVALSGTEAHAVAARLDNGGSSSQTTPPPVPPTPFATPPVKAKKWQGNGWQGQ